MEDVPFHERGLELDYFKGFFQLKPFYNSMIHEDEKNEKTNLDKVSSQSKMRDWYETDNLTSI